MNTDELMALIEIVSKLTDGAVSAIIWILAVKYGTAIVHGLLTAGTIIAVVVILSRALFRWSFYIGALKSIRDMLNVGSSGPLSEYEVRRVIQRIKEHIPPELRSHED